MKEDKNFEERLPKDKSGNPVCNFNPVVISRVEKYIEGKDKPEIDIKVRLQYASGVSEPIRISKENLGDVDWNSIDDHCQLDANIRASVAKRILAHRIREGILHVKTEKLYVITQVGNHIIENTPLFFTGDRLIRSPDLGKEFKIEFQPTPYRLAVDPNITEEEAATKLFQFIGLSPNAISVMLAQVLLYFMRSAYELAYKAPAVCVMLYGRTQSFKTTIAKLLTQVYNLDIGLSSLPRFNSSAAAIAELLTEKNDVVVAIDDIYKAESKQLQREQEELLINLTRWIGDNVLPIKLKNGKLSKNVMELQCGCLLIGEFVINSLAGSSAARCLPAELSPAPNKEILKEYVANPLILPTAFNYFLAWYIEHYDDVVELLKQWHKEYQKTEITDEARLDETHYFLFSAYYIYTRYCYDRGLIEEETLQNLNSDFSDLLTELVVQQAKRVNQGTVPQYKESDYKIDYLSVIKRCYHNGAFALAGNVNDFYERDDYDGVIHNDCLCIRSTKIESILRKAGLPSDRKKFLEAMETHGALMRRRSKKTKQINGTKGKHFYFIPLYKIT